MSLRSLTMCTSMRFHIVRALSRRVQASCMRNCPALGSAGSSLQALMTTKKMVMFSGVRL